MVDVEDARGLADPLEEQPEPDEVERGVVQHAAAQESHAELGLLADVPVEAVAVVVVGRARRRALDPEVQLVDALPHFERNDLPHRPRVLAGRSDGAAQAHRHLVVEGQVRLHGLAVGHRLDAAEGCEPLLFAGRDDDGLPALELGEIRIQRKRRRDLEEPRRALGALEVTPEPEAVIGDPRDHAPSTQVSFEPPPWLELTTYDPSTSATLVSPPGSTHGPLFANSRYGRKSIRRGTTVFDALSQVGQVESSTRRWAM